MQSAILPRYDQIPVQKNHISMTKFKVIEDEGLVVLLGELDRWTNEAITSPEPVPAPAAAPTPTPAQARKPATPKEFAAYQHRNELQLEFDHYIEDFTVCLPTQLLGRPDSYSFNLPPPLTISNMRCYSDWQRILHQYRSSESETDVRLDRIPLPLVPWENNHFLAEIKSSELYRILSSLVSERQKGSDFVLVHCAKYTLSEFVHLRKQVVQVSYGPDDGHWIDHTKFVDMKFANAITGSALIKPSMDFPVNFVSSSPGYEEVEMPLALSFFLLPRDHEVIFASQGSFGYALLQILIHLTDDAWDHDDAFECGVTDEIPVKIRVEEYAEFVGRTRPLGYGIKDARLLHASRLLVRDSEIYFSNQSDRTFEIETVVRLLRAFGEAEVDTERPANAEVLEEWYNNFGYEGSRWLLLALSLTLGANVYSAQFLPPAFEALRNNSVVYVY